MSPTRRDEFSQKQIETLLKESAASVMNRWPTIFRDKPPHFICEHCHFVSDLRRHYEVDHILPCDRGGSNDRVSADDAQLLSAGDIDAICRIGVNQQLLCRGCNQAKKEHQFIPPGAGFAYRHPEWDLNPDHVHHGRPTVTEREQAEYPEPYDPRRYS